MLVDRLGDRRTGLMPIDPHCHPSEKRHAKSDCQESERRNRRLRFAKLRKDQSGSPGGEQNQSKPSDQHQVVGKFGGDAKSFHDRLTRVAAVEHDRGHNRRCRAHGQQRAERKPRPPTGNAGRLA